MDFGTSWLDKLWEAQAEGAARKDPWKLRLERMRGKIDYDGLERVTTQMLFDVLERRHPGVGVAQPDPAALHYMQAPVRVRRARGAHDVARVRGPHVLKAAGI